jgi:hypothetical protein
MFRFALLGAVLLCTACGQAAEPTHWIPMEDGTKLATDVYVPDRPKDEKWPTILMRSTYSRQAGDPAAWNKKGYASVMQDVRGMYSSEGEEYVFHWDGWREGYMDGAVTVDWIRDQPWSNGKIGTYGGSALSLTQMLLAPSTDGLTCQVLEVTASDFYRDVAYHGGVFRKSLCEGWLTMIGQAHLIDIYKSHPLEDDFWAYYDCNAKAGDITAPGLFVGGWYDIFAQGTIDAFVAREERGGEGAKGNNYLVMKWAPHGPDTTEDYAYNENRFELKVSQFREAFYNYHLKGKEDALEDYAKVTYYTYGADTPGAPGNEWRTADAWPPVEATETAWYLGPGESLDTTAPTGEAGSVSFTFDPADPYPTYGGNNLMPGQFSGPYDQRKFSDVREDLVTFYSPPLDEPMEITGRVTVRLYVSSDAPDTDFTAKLIDVYPEGDERELNILDNIRRVKTRNGYDAFAPPLEGPDDVVLLEIDLWSTSWIFNAGHRIGLHISSSNYPRFEVNPNNGENFPGGDTPMRKAVNAVHYGGAKASALVLPVVE